MAIDKDLKDSMNKKELRIYNEKTRSSIRDPGLFFPGILAGLTAASFLPGAKARTPSGMAIKNFITRFPSAMLGGLVGSALSDELGKSTIKKVDKNVSRGIAPEKGTSIDPLITGLGIGGAGGITASTINKTKNLMNLIDNPSYIPKPLSKKMLLGATLGTGALGALLRHLTISGHASKGDLEKKSSKNKIETEREGFIRDDLLKTLPSLLGIAGAIGAGKFFDKKMHIEGLHPVKKLMLKGKTMGLGSLVSGGLYGSSLGERGLQKRIDNKQNFKGIQDLPIATALASGAIGGTATKRILNILRQNDSKAVKGVIAANSVLAGILGGLWGKNLITEKTSSVKKYGLDKVAYTPQRNTERLYGLDKVAVDSSGVSQLKQRRTIQKRKYTAEGTGLGAAGGGFGAYKMTKALGPKWNIPATIAGTLLGGAAGRYVGRKGSKTKTKVLEGVIKKQEKSKDNKVKAPAIKRHNLSGLLAYNR